jgi:hypothetical protein
MPRTRDTLWTAAVLLVVVLLVVSDHGAQGKLKKKQQQQQQQEEGEQVELATEEHAHDTEESESAQQQRHEIGGVEEIQPLPNGSIPPEIMELAEVRKSAVHFHTQKGHARPPMFAPLRTHDCCGYSQSSSPETKTHPTRTHDIHYKLNYTRTSFAPHSHSLTHSHSITLTLTLSRCTTNHTHHTPTTIHSGRWPPMRSVCRVNYCTRDCGWSWTTPSCHRGWSSHVSSKPNVR